MPIHAVITGASGFIGSATVLDLLKSGHNVTVLLRSGSNPYRLEAFKTLNRIVYTNLVDQRTVAELKSHRPDVFIHCGWHGVSSADRNQAFQLTDNIQIAIDSVKLAAAVDCVRWVGLGSQAEYGSHNRKIDENAHLEPTTLYGKAKLATGIACQALCDALGISSAWLRIFSTYGPGDSPSWFLQYALREFQAGRAPELTLCTQRWDYLHVADAARAITAVANATSVKGNFNLGSGKALPLKYWLELLRQELGCSVEPKYGVVPFRSDQTMHLEADISRLSSATGWTPIISPAEGVKTLIAEKYVN